MSNYKELVSLCDAEIKAGHIENVPKRLAALNTARIPREWRLPLANICRRAALYSLGLTLLNKLVQPTARRTESIATPAELAEYCVLLMRIGAVNEALQRLGGIDSAQVPDAQLFRAFGHFYRWEFAQAVECLNAYVRSPISNYARLVGNVNLAHAYVESNQFALALPLLEENISTAAAGGNHNLQSLCHVYRSQISLRASEFGRAKEDLQKAQSLLGNSGNKFGIVQKWLSISEALETKSVKPLEQFKIISRGQQDWEALREADLFSLKLDFNQVRFLHLLFGTPIAGYRERIFAEIPERPFRSVYVLGPKDAPRMDLRTGEVNGKRAINPGRKCHQLIELLLRDFYEPRRIGSLFFDLFPGEYFNIDSSPDRVHQIIWRTRRWLENKSIPVNISETNGFYALNISGEFSFSVPLERRAVTLENLHFEKLKSVMPEGQTFSLNQAHLNMKLSKPTLWRILTWAEENGKIERLGENSATLYKFSEPPAHSLHKAS